MNKTEKNTEMLYNANNNRIHKSAEIYRNVNILHTNCMRKRITKNQYVINIRISNTQTVFWLKTIRNEKKTATAAAAAAKITALKHNMNL